MYNKQKRKVQRVSKLKANKKKTVIAKTKINKKSIWKDFASWQLLLLCIPALSAYVIFNYIPMGVSLTIPFKNYIFSKGILGSEWVGLDNFAWVVSSPIILRALRNTFFYGLWFLIVDPIANVAIALLLYEISHRRALKIYQTIMSLPNFLSMVIMGYIVYAFLSPQNGFLNRLLMAFGIEPIDAYIMPAAWPLILTIVILWKGVGMGSMLYYAVLVGIDASLYEAAEIDGATRRQKMRYISIPHVIPVVCLFTILNAGSLVSGSFDLFYLIPRDSAAVYETTDILNTYVYRALTEGSYSQGATVGFVQSIAGMILVITSNLIVKKISPDNSLF